MTYTYHSSAKKMVALSFVFILVAGMLVKLGLYGNHVVPSAMNELMLRLTAVYLPFLLVGLTIGGYLYLLVSHLGRRLEVGSLGVTLVSGAKSITVGWASMIVHRASAGALSSSLISDGRHHIRLQSFFWPDHDDILNRIERTLKHNRSAKTVKVEV